MSNHSSLRKSPSFILFSIVTLLGMFVPNSKAELTAKLSDGDNLSLIGIGIHQELRHDIYIGALFASSAITDVEQLKNDNISKRMSVRFVSNYSNRKLAQHWKSRLAINNPREQWQPFTREIVNFSNIFKRTFEVGDELNIDHVPGIGTQIYLNSTLFHTVKKPGFMTLLMNVWLGNIPPTKAFKNSIRGLDADSVKNGYIANFESLVAVKGRFDADLVSKVAQVETPPEKEEAKKAPVKVAKAEVKETPKKTPVVTEPPPKTPAENSPQVVDTAVVDKKDMLPDIKLDTKAADIPKQKPAPKKVAIVEKPIEEDLFDADLITGSYTRDLINSIKEFQEYPRKALIEKEEGDVLAKVIISADGEIIDVELLERSGSRTLDKAASKIIKKAAPFQAIPKELNLTKFEFEVPISFQL